MLMLRVSEVAERLQVPVSTVNGLLDQRVLGYYRFGGVRRLSETDLERFLKACRVDPQSPESPFVSSAPLQELIAQARRAVWR